MSYPALRWCVCARTRKHREQEQEAKKGVDTTNDCASCTSLPQTQGLGFSCTCLSFCLSVFLSVVSASDLGIGCGISVCPFVCVSQHFFRISFLRRLIPKTPMGEISAAVEGGTLLLLRLWITHSMTLPRSSPYPAHLRYFHLQVTKTTSILFPPQ